MKKIDRYYALHAQLKEGVRLSKEDWMFVMNYRRCMRHANQLRRFARTATGNIVSGFNTAPR